MDKNEIILDDDLLDDVEEIEEEDMDEAHDPMNAESKSNDSVRKAAGTGPKAKARKGDKMAQENGGKPYKSDKGIVREMVAKMNEMSGEEIRALHSVIMDDNFDATLTSEENDVLEDVEYDMSEDIANLVESEATLSEGFKDKAGIIMEMAVKSKLKEEIVRLEEAYEESLEEAKEEMIELLDSYLDHVVETWLQENELAVERGVRTDIAESFMNGLKALFEESYIEIPDERVDLVEELVERVEDLEEELNSNMDTMLTMAEENEMFKRDSIILEFADDLADTQLDKLTKLADAVDFDDEDTFRDRVSMIKETYFGKNKNTAENNVDIYENNDGDEDGTVEVSGSMANYVNALRNSKK
jgi:hypothetical protein